MVNLISQYLSYRISRGEMWLLRREKHPKINRILRYHVGRISEYLLYKSRDLCVMLERGFVCNVTFPWELNVVKEVCVHVKLTRDELSWIVLLSPFLGNCIFQNSLYSFKLKLAKVVVWGVADISKVEHLCSVGCWTEAVRFKCKVSRGFPCSCSLPSQHSFVSSSPANQQWPTAHHHTLLRTSLG